LQPLEHLPADGGKQGVDIKSLFLKKPIGRRPIGELLGAGAEHPADGLTPKANQGAQGQDARTLKGAFLGKSATSLVEEPVELGGYSSRFFFEAEGGVFNLRKTRLALSSMIHSTVSPRSNSMAWAMAAGKLMYHCSLCRRLINWTLVG
jgi:hypothetical protein